MNLVTVIPARSGSKGIPGKNVKPLAGKPLLAWSVEYSLRCPLVSRTVVSTDSPDIAATARAFGAETPFLRPAELAADLTQDFPVLLHALEELERDGGPRIDAIALLRPTSPLRPPQLIERAVRSALDHPDWSSVRAVTASSEHPFRQWVMTGDFMAGFVPSVREPYNLPRQQLPPVLFQTGDLELVRRETLMAGSVSGDRVLPLLIAREEMADIDCQSDWEAAEKIAGRAPGRQR